MRDDRGVLLVPTARGIEPIDRQRFAPMFLAKHEATRQLSDGLAHAFSRTRRRLRHKTDTPHGEREFIEKEVGWATYCVSFLSHSHLPGTACPRAHVTCVACVAAMFQ